MRKLAVSPLRSGCSGSRSGCGRGMFGQGMSSAEIAARLRVWARPVAECLADRGSGRSGVAEAGRAVPTGRW